MQQGGAHGVADVFWLISGNPSAIVGQRLGDTVKHEANAHAGGEHHGDPGKCGKFRGLIVAAQFDIAEFAQRHNDGERQKYGGA